MNDYVIKADMRFGREGLYDSLWAILYNITTNQFALRDELGVLSSAPYEDVLKRACVLAASEIPIIWYLYKNSIGMKFEIEGKLGGSITIIPVAPYKMKRRVDSEIERIDLGFYIQCCIELCENFSVSDIKAE